MSFACSIPSATTQLSSESSLAIAKSCGAPGKKSTRSTLLSVTASTLALLVALPVMAQETTGVPGSPSATTTIDGRYIPNPPPPFSGKANLSAADSKPGWPPTVVPPKGAPNVLLDHDRRSGLWRQRHLWRRHPDAVHGSPCEGGTALHAVLLHRTVLADAGGAHYRSQPPLRGHRRDRRNVHRVIRATTASSPRTRPPSAPFSGTMATRPRGSARTTTRRPINTALGRSVRSMAQRDGLRVFLWVHGRRDQPVDALSVSRSHPDLSVGREARLQPQLPTWRTRRSVT